MQAIAVTDRFAVVGQPVHRFRAFGRPRVPCADQCATRRRGGRPAEPALLQFPESSPTPFVNGIKAARERIVARDEEDRAAFLRKRGFSKAETAKIIDTVLTEEGHPPASIFDFVQGITRVARDKQHQDVRLEMEGGAKKLLDLAT